jgi:hypothetical protein
MSLGEIALTRISRIAGILAQLLHRDLLTKRHWNELAFSLLQGRIIMAIAAETGNFSKEANKTKAGASTASMADYTKEAASAALDATQQPPPNVADKAKQVASELTNLIHQNPISVLLAGIGLGFLLAHATRRR